MMMGLRWCRILCRCVEGLVYNTLDVFRGVLGGCWGTHTVPPVKLIGLWVRSGYGKNTKRKCES